MRLLILTSLLASVSAYGYRYSRHPQTGECYLQLDLPDGKQNAYAGTNSRYGGNDGKYHHYGNEGKYGTSNSKYDGSASIQHSSLIGGGDNGRYKGSSSSSGSYGSSGGSYGPSGGGYGGTSNKYESSSSNNRYNSPSSGYGGSSSSSSSSSGGYGGNRNSYSSPSSSEYNSDSGNRNVGSGTKYSSSSYGASDKSPSYSSKGSSSSYSGGGNRFSSSKSPSYSSTYPAASSSSSYSSSSSLSRPSYSTRPVDYKEEEYSSKKHLSSSSETMKQTTIVEGNGSGGGSSYGTRNPSYSSSYEGNRNSQAPQFEDCGVYEYYSKTYRKCVRFGSREDEEEQREKKGSSYGGGNRYSGDGGSRESGYYGGSSSGGSSYGGNRPSSSSYGGSGGSSYGSSSSSRHTPSSGGSYSSSSSGNSGYGSAGKYGNDDGAYLKKDFAREVLSAHNSYRAKHFTPPVTLDEEMSLKAQAWAVDLASGRVQFGHSPSAVEGKFGESLEIVNDSSVDGSSIVEDWYREKRNYNFDKPVLVKKPKSSANSHFTAILWKGTRKIGVGKATANDGRTFVVVNYFPAGNIVDILEDNVSRGRTDLQSSREQFF